MTGSSCEAGINSTGTFLLLYLAEFHTISTLSLTSLLLSEGKGDSCFVVVLSHLVPFKEGILTQALCWWEALGRCWAPCFRVTDCTWVLQLSGLALFITAKTGTLKPRYDAWGAASQLPTLGSVSANLCLCYLCRGISSAQQKLPQLPAFLWQSPGGWTPPAQATDHTIRWTLLGQPSPGRTPVLKMFTH